MIHRRRGRFRPTAARVLALEDRIAPDDMMGLSAWTWILPGLAMLEWGRATSPAFGEEATDATDGGSASNLESKRILRREDVPLAQTATPRAQPRLRSTVARALTATTLDRAETVADTTVPDREGPSIEWPQGPRFLRSSPGLGTESMAIAQPTPSRSVSPWWERTSPRSQGGDLAPSALSILATTSPGVAPIALSWNPDTPSASPIATPVGEASIDSSTAVTPAHVVGVVDIDGKDAEAGAAYLDEIAESDPGVLIQDVDAADRASLVVRATGVPGAKRVVTWDNPAKVIIRDKATNQVKLNGFKLLEDEGEKEFTVVASANMGLGETVKVTMQAEGGGSYLGADDLQLTRLQFMLVNPGDTNNDGNINDDANAGNRFVGNEFTFSAANPGVLTLPVSVRIRPDTPAIQEKFKDKVHLTVDPIGDSHIQVGPRRTTLAWDRGASLDDFRIGLAAYDATTKLWTATATFTGLPARNSDFGVKTATARLTNLALPAKTAQFEVFWPLLVNAAGARNDANFAKNHPGPDLNAVRADSANQFPRDATRAPNWFYYWRQEVAGTGQDRYADTLVAGVFGVSPPVFYFQNNYVGRHDRVLIFAPAQGEDPDPDGAGPREKTTGIDAFRDTFIHENFHSLSESVTYTNEGFGVNINGANLVVATDWSFNIAKPGVLPVPPLNFAGGRIYNHYRDTNNDGDFADATDLNKDGDTDDLVGGVPENEDMDRDGDSVPNWSDPTPGVFGPGTDLANRALNSEPDKEDVLAEKDWGNPGKNHATKAYNT